MSETILTNDQVAVLKAVGQNTHLAKQFYLTGGTPLAAFYLHHRYSEDLDFFSEREVDIAPLNIFFHELKKPLGIISLDFQQSYDRNLFFLHLPSGVLKTEFTYFPFLRIEKGRPQYGVEVDSPLDIAVNKLFTIYQRTKARDYIDLYYLCQKQGFSVADLVGKARIKFDTTIDPLQLGTQFVKVGEALDLPRMLIDLAPDLWQKFFIEEAKKLKPIIIDNS